MDNGGIHRFSNFHYTSPYLTRYRCAASKIAREEVDQRADERVVTIAFLDQLLKPDYAHALSIELPSIVSPPSIPNENSPPLFLLSGSSPIDTISFTSASFRNRPFQPFQVKLRSTDGWKEERASSIRVDIDCTRFPGNNKAGDTLEERERECVYACARSAARDRNREREGGVSLSLSSDRKLSIASGPIASASPLIKSRPVIQEGRPFAGRRASRLCTPASSVHCFQVAFP